jgi:SAM-dependent methyltransferase
MMKILDYKDELKRLENVIRLQARAGSTLRILEAGCGREWYFELDDIAYEVTGVDLDGHAMAFRKDQKHDLDHCIVGDLHTVDLPAGHFDVIYCSFVLEHIRGAEHVLDNFVRWLKPGGTLIIRVPDVTGVQTFLARRLPRWFAILYYKLAWGIKNAGKPGFAPYPAYYDDVISPRGFNEYCASRKLTLVEEIGVGNYVGRGSGPFRYALPIVAKLIALLSAGKIHARHVDRTFLARKYDDPEDAKSIAGSSRRLRAGALRSADATFSVLRATPGA